MINPALTKSLAAKLFILSVTRSNKYLKYFDEENASKIYPFLSKLDENKILADYYFGSDKDSELASNKIMVNLLKTSTITLVEAIVYYASIYVPKETGNLLSSLTVKRLSEVSFKISFDLGKAPYGIYVHEIQNKKHELPTRCKFLEEAVSSAIAATKINFLSMNLVVENNELSITVNSNEDNLSSLYDVLEEPEISRDVPLFDLETLLNEKDMTTDKLTSETIKADVLEMMNIEKKKLTFDPKTYSLDSLAKLPHYGLSQPKRIFNIGSKNAIVALTDKKTSLIRKSSLIPGYSAEKEMYKTWSNIAFLKQLEKINKMTFDVLDTYLRS